MRAQSTRTPAIVAINKDSDSVICHNGGVCTTIRAYINTGAKNGTIDIQTTAGASGVFTAALSMVTERTSGITIRNWSCWPSCSVVEIAPIAADIVLYSK